MQLDRKLSNKRIFLLSTFYFSHEGDLRLKRLATADMDLPTTPRYEPLEAMEFLRGQIRTQKARKFSFDEQLTTDEMLQCRTHMGLLFSNLFIFRQHGYKTCGYPTSFHPHCVPMIFIALKLRNKTGGYGNRTAMKAGSGDTAVLSLLLAIFNNLFAFIDQKHFPIWRSKQISIGKWSQTNWRIEYMDAFYSLSSVNAGAFADRYCSCTPCSCAPLRGRKSSRWNELKRNDGRIPEKRARY